MAGLVPRHKPCGNGGGDASQPPGVGHDDAFNVLNNVPADGDNCRLGQTPQGVPRHRGGVSQRDGLGAAHGGHQLLLQNGDVFLIFGEMLHREPPCLYVFFSISRISSKCNKKRSSPSRKRGRNRNRLDLKRGNEMKKRGSQSMPSRAKISAGVHPKTAENSLETSSSTARENRSSIEPGLLPQARAFSIFSCRDL